MLHVYVSIIKRTVRLHDCTLLSIISDLYRGFFTKTSTELWSTDENVSCAAAKGVVSCSVLSSSAPSSSKSPKEKGVELKRGLLFLGGVSGRRAAAEEDGGAAGSKSGFGTYIFSLL